MVVTKSSHQNSLRIGIELSFNSNLPASIVLVDPVVTTNLYCNFAYPYWEGCVICNIYLRQLLSHPVRKHVVLILGGNSEYVAHARRKIGLFG